MSLAAKFEFEWNLLINDGRLDDLIFEIFFVAFQDTTATTFARTGRRRGQRSARRGRGQRRRRRSGQRCRYDQRHCVEEEGQTFIHSNLTGTDELFILSQTTSCDHKQDDQLPHFQTIPDATLLDRLEMILSTKLVDAALFIFDYFSSA